MSDFEVYRKRIGLKTKVIVSFFAEFDPNTDVYKAVYFMSVCLNQSRDIIKIYEKKEGEI